MLTSDLPAIFVRVFAFVFGALWGSFFNVAIYRWPREMSVVTPPSHCPACKTPISAFRNVPIFGYLLLRGRAACCGARMSPRYPLVEVLGAVLSLALAERFLVAAPEGTELAHAATEWLLYFMFAGGLLVATFVDFEWMEIPDEVSLPGAALGLLTAELRDAPGPADAAIGAGLGFLAVQVLFVWLYERFLGRRGMGEGDAKLLLMIGAFVGWKGVLFALLGGATQGLLAAMLAMAAGVDLAPTRPDEAAEPDDADDPHPEAPDPSDADAAATRLKMPFGPFLALGALEYLFFGDALVAWYAGLFSA